MNNTIHAPILQDNLQRFVPAAEMELRCAAEHRARLAAEEALRQCELKYRFVFESLPEAALLIDPSTGGILDANAQAEALFQRPRTELLGKSQTELCPPTSADSSPLPSPDNLTPPNHRPLDTQILRNDGTVIPVRLCASLAPSSNQPHRLALYSDVSERNQLEEQMRQAQKMDAVGQIASGVAHDFNNLLAVVGGNAELLLMDAADLSPRQKQSLEEIVATVAHAANLTRQLLLFSRKFVMHFQMLDLNDLVANLAKMLKRVVREDIRLDFSYAKQLHLVRADPGLIEQVLLNLVVNARDAMPHGGRLRIATEESILDKSSALAIPGARDGVFVCLVVSDSGSGIAPEHLRHIFEPFFTTKAPGKGVGIGLATAYGIVREHQGWIQVSSQAGQGASFKIFLPASLPSNGNGAIGSIHAGSTPAAGLGCRGNGESILLVEDDESVRLTMRQVLENHNYHVRVAAHAPEAIQTWSLNAGAVDVLLSDIILPEGMTGRELADHLRMEKKDLKVILMSGYNAEAVLADPDLLQRTQYFFLQKPSSSNVLLQTVRRCLDNKRPRSDP
jgi:PAS domain S-box-containing protein